MSFITHKALLLLVVTLLNSLYVAVHLWRATSVGSQTYSWRGHDFPTYLPLPRPQRTVITPLRDESASYPLLGLASDQNWFDLTTASAGYVRLGPENRLFMVTMYHELHCLRVLNLAFEPTHINGWHGHIKHCLDYIRQLALCSPDLTLERVISQDSGTEEIAPDEFHECKDWKQVDSFMQDRWEGWLKSMGNSSDVDLRVTSHDKQTHGHE